MRAWCLLAATSFALTGCAAAYDAPVASASDSVPEYSAVDASASEDAQVASLLARMSLERKVAQLLQPQINSFTAEDMEQYRFGSYLNGGNGGPYGDEFAPAAEWLRLADEMYDASVKPLPNGEPIIPTIWGTDAVHGHTNVVGATIFPHNIGLGATGDADLVRRIGAATAVEIEVTGIDWNFSPTVAVARDDRWGRTYESYSEDPELVAQMGAALVEGLQGTAGSKNYLGDGHVLATAKHFFGDGGTDEGVDQGEVNGDIEALKSVHAVPYPAAISAGVETIMASFNSINGRKMHGNKPLLNDYLRGDLKFDGLVVGDWNGHGQIKGCTNADCPQALMAGLDIYMVPDDWKELHANLIRQVNDGTIPVERLDDAVGRVLRMKLRAGVLGGNARRPSDRANAGDVSLLGSAEHRALGREAVGKSMVILGNDGVLPLDPSAKIIVTGPAADNIAQQSGGWTLTWQGGDELTNVNFPGATSIGAGLAQVGQALGGEVVLDGSGGTELAADADVAVIVFGEEPYAEFAGDRKDLTFRDETGLDLLRSYKAAGVKTVAVFLSGRPMWMNREINASNAFVAAWLPGSEGAGIADVLYGQREASGRLSFSWPQICDGQPLNGPEGALFARGYGLSLNDETKLPMLSESCERLTAGPASDWYSNGRLADGVTAVADNANLPNLRGASNGITARGLDRNAQEDARQINFAPGASLTFGGPAGVGGWQITYAVESRPTGQVMLSAGGQPFDVTAQMSLAAGKGWREMVLSSECLGPMESSLTIASQGALELQIASIAREEIAAGAQCSF
jgi:beta-glucosidase